MNEITIFYIIIQLVVFLDFAFFLLIKYALKKLRYLQYTYTYTYIYTYNSNIK